MTPEGVLAACPGFKEVEELGIGVRHSILDPDSWGLDWHPIAVFQMGPSCPKLKRLVLASRELPKSISLAHNLKLNQIREDACIHWR